MRSGGRIAVRTGLPWRRRIRSTTLTTKCQVGILRFGTIPESARGSLDPRHAVRTVGEGLSRNLEHSLALIELSFLCNLDSSIARTTSGATQTMNVKTRKSVIDVSSPAKQERPTDFEWSWASSLPSPTNLDVSIRASSAGKADAADEERSRDRPLGSQ